MLALCGLSGMLVAVATGLHVVQLSRVVVADVHADAATLADEILGFVRVAASRGAPDELWPELRADPRLRQLLTSNLAYSRHVAYVYVADRSGTAVIHSQDDLVGQVPAERPALDELLSLGPFGRLRTLWTPGGEHEYKLDVAVDGEPLGSIHVGSADTLVREELASAVEGGLALGLTGLLLSSLLALAVARLTLRPLREVCDQVDKMRQGELLAKGAAEWDVDFGDLSAQLALLGEEVSSERLSLLGQKGSLEEIIDHLQDAAILLNAETEILYFNRSAAVITGGDLEALVGERLEAVLGDDHPLVDLVGELGDSRRSVENRLLALPLTGRFAECLASTHLAGRRDEAPSGIVLLVEDLESIKMLQALVSHGARMVTTSRVTSEVVHEVRNPLNAINLHVELLKSELAAPGERVERALDVLSREIQRLDRLVGQFLDFVHPGEMRRERIDIRPLLEQVVELQRSDLGCDDVRFEIDLGSDTMEVDGDEDQLHRMFLNLVRNACEAVAGGGVVSVHASVEGGRRAIVTIGDDGCGIDQDAIEEVFQLYYTTKAEGSGIGLPMAYRVVQQHLGQILMESEIGVGTRVIVKLPLADAFDRPELGEEGFDEPAAGERPS